jgi:chromosome segregation ATPase
LAARPHLRCWFSRPVCCQVINYINEKQAELETERAELAEYQSLDKQRRAIEYVLTDYELGKVKSSLEEIEAARMTLMERLVQLREQEAVLGENTAGLREALKAAEDDLKAARADKAALTDRLQRIASRKVEAVARVKDLQSEAVVEDKSQVRSLRLGLLADACGRPFCACSPDQRALEEELRDVDKRIEKAQAELDALVTILCVSVCYGVWLVVGTIWCFTVDVAV